MGLGKHFGHTALHDAQGQALGQCGFAYAGVAHKQRVVLAATAEHLHGAVQLRLPAHQGVDLALPRPLGEVYRILGKRIGGLGLLAALGAGLLHAARTAALFQAVRHKGQHVQAFYPLLAQIE